MGRPARGGEPDSSLSAKWLSRDASVNLFRKFATLKVADALHALAGDVTVKAPELGFIVRDLLAVPRFAAPELANSVDFVSVERRRQVTQEPQGVRFDPDGLVARYDGDCVGRDKDVRYANRYIGVFAFRNGKMTLWCEYDNPLLTQASIAGFAT